MSNCASHDSTVCTAATATATATATAAAAIAAATATAVAATKAAGVARVAFERVRVDCMAQWGAAAERLVIKKLRRQFGAAAACKSPSAISPRASAARTGGRTEGGTDGWTEEKEDGRVDEERDGRRADRQRTSVLFVRADEHILQRYKGIIKIRIFLV